MQKIFQKRYIFTSENTTPAVCWFFSPSAVIPSQPCWSEVPTVPGSAAPDSAALKCSTEKWSKKPQDLHCLFCSLQPRSCIENMLISKMWTLISRLTVLMNISQNPIPETENFCKNFSIVWLWPCKAEPTPWLWSSIGSRSAGEGEACKGTGAGE